MSHLGMAESPPFWPDLRLGEELREISKILDQNSQISELFLHDLCDKVSVKKGAPGMSAEQVLRAALLKQIHRFSFERLAFHLQDSLSGRVFCRLPLGHEREVPASLRSGGGQLPRNGWTN